MSIQTATNQFNAALEDAETSLTEAKQAVIHWEGQVLKLTELKKAMTAILSPEDFEAPPPKTSRTAAKKATVKATKSSDIPATNTEFWLSCLTTEPQKTSAILAVAVGKLNITGADNIKTLNARQTAFLQKQAAEGGITSAGERANRTYSLNP